MRLIVWLSYPLLRSLISGDPWLFPVLGNCFARSDSRKIQGLAAVFVEATPLLAGAPVPQVVKDQCAALNLPTQGNAAGNEDPNNLKGLPEGPFPQILGWRPKGIGAMFGCVVSLNWPRPVDKSNLMCFMHA